MRASSTPQQEPTIDETDLALLNAMQLSPRAPWSEIAGVVDVDAGTLARRWERLTANGAAWLAVDPGLPREGRMASAFVEVDCDMDQILPAATAFAADPRVASVAFVSGSCDLLLTVYAAGLDAMSRFMLHGTSAVSGIRSVRSHLISQVVVEGSRWELGALDPVQRRRIGRPTVHPAVAGTLLPDDELRELHQLLTDDARMGISELAARLGVSRPTARRRLHTALGSRQLVVRCDVSQPLSGWPVSVAMWMSAPADQHAATAAALAAMPETRLTVGIVGGPANLMVMSWLRRLEDMHRLEAVLAERLPRLRVVDRVVTMRRIKRLGRYLTEEGYGTPAVVFDPWREPVAAGGLDRPNAAYVNAFMQRSAHRGLDLA
ncbi:Lrp/AsnC family transcriptional regulator [Pseudonocardia sp. TRM90224]|uniref:Lrp/AsnC family transcriptional regulator n=1 Tax=Pseudonocardia sp. TRM90224 TaxID=2812678 RepID=UPI001E3442C0|nr:Lrp/AsnC family transcriptional regulator [Pseudonocardia sp. TRM90224]